MKMMFQYLRSHRKSVALFSVCAAILTVLYILFDVNIRLIAYGWLVCSAVGLVLWVSKITCGFSKINCGMESWANGNSPKSVVGRNRWILNKKMVKKSGNRVTFGCLIWYKTYFLYYLNFGPFTACFLYGPLRKQTSFHGLGTAKMAAFFRCEKRKWFRICSKFP